MRARDHLKDLGIEGKSNIKCNLKYGMRVDNGFTCLRAG
jgi:hypothetical protein